MLVLFDKAIYGLNGPARAEVLILCWMQEFLTWN